MGFRFSRRIRILPGLRLNLSKSGVSTSIGGRGAWLTFGKRGTRATVGLPGTGLSYSTTVAPQRPVPDSAAARPEPAVDPAPRGNAGRGFLWIALILLAVTWVAFRALS
jgi:Protein of unknown function (DUF4236)